MKRRPRASHITAGQDRRSEFAEMEVVSPRHGCSRSPANTLDTQRGTYLAVRFPAAELLTTGSMMSPRSSWFVL